MLDTNMQIVSPLFQPIMVNGQVYFTSHYFHQMYRNNKEDGGKYEELKNFNKLIRSIEAYPIYIDKQDIVELSWTDVKNRGSNMEPLKPLFEASSYNPIMLINATAQIALTQHLDDEVSKHASVKINESVAKNVPLLGNQSTPRISAPTPRQIMSALKLAGEMIKQNPAVDKVLVDTITLNQFTKATGIETAGYLPCLPVPVTEEIGYMNQTDIAKKIEGLTRVTVGVLLEQLGLKIKDSGENRLTKLGEPHATMVPYSRGGHNGYEIRWKDSVIPLIQDYLDDDTNYFASA